MPASVLNHQKEVEHTVEVLPKKDKEAVTLSEGESDSKEKVAAIMVVAKDTAITMVVISDSIIAPPIAIGTTC